MSLSAAYEVIRASLSASGVATSVLSRNIANIDNPHNARKTVTSTNQGGITPVIDIQNTVDHALLENAIAKEASLESSRAFGAALNELHNAMGDPAQGGNIASLISNLRSALQLASATPNDETLARAAVASANEVATLLRDSRAAVEKLRSDADAMLVEGVASLEGMLGEFAVVNKVVVSGSALGADVTDHIDRRNKMMFEMGEFIEVRAAVRKDNDMVLFAAGDITLFETNPRSLEISTAAPLQPGQAGSLLIIDGLSTISDHRSKVGGKMGAALLIRDQLAILAGRQLDEMARGLIEVFSEVDQTGSRPALPGLFTSPFGRSPVDTNRIDGLALVIEVNENVDPSRGGVVSRLRDGGISEPSIDAYTYNKSGVEGFSNRLIELMDKLSQVRQFDGAAGLDRSANILSYSAASVGWLQSQRTSSNEQFEAAEISSEQATSAWQSKIGVNVDYELTRMITLQQSYQASARLMAIIDTMFGSIIQVAE